MTRRTLHHAHEGGGDLPPNVYNLARLAVGLATAALALTTFCLAQHFGVVN
jgi:hypothetical protein